MPTYRFLPSRCAVPENDDVRHEYRSSQPRLKKQLSAVLPAHGRPTMTMVFVTCASTHQSCVGKRPVTCIPRRRPGVGQAPRPRSHRVVVVGARMVVGRMAQLIPSDVARRAIVRGDAANKFVPRRSVIAGDEDVAAAVWTVHNFLRACPWRRRSS